MEQASRHRAPRRSTWSGRARAMGLGAAGAAVAGGLVVAAITAAGPPVASSSDDDCASGGRPLQVVAAPEIAPAVSAVLRSLASDGGADCPGTVVRAVPPRRTMRAMAAAPSGRPDVWIPDSSAWTSPVLSQGVSLPGGGPSVATSPFVLAVPRSAVDARSTLPLTAPRLLAQAPRLRWALPDPARSPSAAAAVLSLRAALAATPGGAGRIAEIVRAGAGRPPSLTDLAGLRVRTALPVTEQQVLSQPRSGGMRRLTVAYSRPGYTADYPFLVLTTDREARVQATALLRALRGEPGRRLLAADGFRDPHGVLGAVEGAGIDDAVRPPRVPTAAEIRTAVRTVALIRRPSRVLAVVDVSGSMGQLVGSTGESRLSLALRGLLTGLAAYPDDTVTGLWTFSTRLTPTTDYRRLVPLVRLGAGPDGTIGRSRLAQALTQVQVRVGGGTALYDTTWAAVQAVRRGWQPTHANGVVLVTDGANQDPAGLSLPRLLDRLRAGPRDRPVPVYGVAIGPDADRRSLDAIARATGGQAYTVLDPRQVVPAIQDAVGRRG